MEKNRRYSVKNILLASLWSVLGAATVFLLGAAIKGKSEHQCRGIEINIHGVSNNFFVDKADILNAISKNENANPVGKAIGTFNLRRMEDQLEKDIWIKSAELFFDNNEILQVVVYEREPVARVFTSAGTTFYIDQELTMLPLSDKFSARLPVFTNFPSDKKVLSKADSSLLNEVLQLSLAIQKDSFSMAMIEQVDINTERSFDMVPKIGSQLIEFGNAADGENKLNKLKIFYKEVMAKAGWNTYSVINVGYKNQVVARRKGTEDIIADSLRTLQLMEMIAKRSQQQADDSLRLVQPSENRKNVDSTMILQSIQRDEPGEIDEPQAVQQAPPPVVEKQAVETKPKRIEVKQPPVKIDTQRPKAVMRNKNDY